MSRGTNEPEDCCSSARLLPPGEHDCRSRLQGASSVSPETANLVISDFLKTVSEMLGEAVRLAKAAEACAESGSPREAVEIVMGIEPLMFDANTLLNAACLLKPRCVGAD